MLGLVCSAVFLLLHYSRLCFTKLEPLLIWAFHARLPSLSLPEKKPKTNPQNCDSKSAELLFSVNCFFGLFVVVSDFYFYA